MLKRRMGLGKTIMTIALLAHLAVQNLGSMHLIVLAPPFDASVLTRKEVWGPHLVVVPTSLLMNWVKELQKWAPGIGRAREHGRACEHLQNGLVAGLKVCAYYGNAKDAIMPGCVLRL